MNVRGGGRAEERVLLERLEGEAAEEGREAVAESAVGAVVDEHGDEEDEYAGDGGGRDEPGRPAAVVWARPEAGRVQVHRRRRGPRPLHPDLEGAVVLHRGSAVDSFRWREA